MFGLPNCSVAQNSAICPLPPAQTFSLNPSAPAWHPPGPTTASSSSDQSPVTLPNQGRHGVVPSELWSARRLGFGVSFFKGSQTLSCSLLFSAQHAPTSPCKAPQLVICPHVPFSLCPSTLLPAPCRLSSPYRGPAPRRLATLYNGCSLCC